MSQKKKKTKPKIDQAQYDGIKAAFLKLAPDQENKEAVRTACQELVKAGHNRAYILKAAKELTGFGFNQKQISPPKEGEEAPAKAVTAVKKKIEAEIAGEAAKKVREAVETGKSLEDVIGPIASMYGFETVPFVLHIYDYWDTWRQQIPEILEENQLLREVIRELRIKITPEARKILANRATMDFVVSVAALGNQTGNYPPKEVLKGMIEVIQEQMTK